MSFLDTLDAVEKEQENGVIKVARESISVEKEKEYCLWVKPTPEGWEWLSEQAGLIHLDVLMPIAQGKRRIRIEEDGSSELTIKRFADEGCIEENSEIGFDAALTFYQDDYVSHLVKRINLPAGDLASKGGKHWDIDVFYTVAGHPQLANREDFDALLNTMRQSSSFGEWVKVELEVERFELESIRDYIPFGVEDTMSSRPQDEATREVIRNFWDLETRI